jgi:hypothetical protein
MATRKWLLLELEWLWIMKIILSAQILLLLHLILTIKMGVVCLNPSTILTDYQERRPVCPAYAYYSVPPYPTVTVTSPPTAIPGTLDGPWLRSDVIPIASIVVSIFSLVVTIGTLIWNIRGPWKREKERGAKESESRRRRNARRRLRQ